MYGTNLEFLEAKFEIGMLQASKFGPPTSCGYICKLSHTMLVIIKEINRIIKELNTLIQLYPCLSIVGQIYKLISFAHVIDFFFPSLRSLISPAVRPKKSPCCSNKIT